MHNDIKKAAEVLKNGGIILYPSDTGWSLGCDATNAPAVEKIYQIKRQKEGNGLVVLMENPALLERYVNEVPEIAWELVDISTTPLTVIYPDARNLVSGLLTEDGSIGIRFTKEAFTMQLLQRFRRPVVCASASHSSNSQPAQFDEIPDEIKNAVDYIVEYGQDDFNPARPAEIIKLWPGGRIEIIGR